MKTLILYYSYGGNTKKIVDIIQKEIGGDVKEIETVKPYTGTYNDVVNQGQREVEQGFMPEIKSLNIDMSQYDCIVLGTPVWWYTVAPAVNTCLHEIDVTGKHIFPFATNGGWIGHTFEDIEKYCANATVHKGLNIKFNEHDLRTSMKDIDEWIKNIQ